MRQQILRATLLLLVAASVETSSPASNTKARTSAVQSFNLNVGKFKEGVTAVDTVVKILTTGLDVAGISTLKPYTDAISKVLSMVLSLLGLLPNSGESALIKEMRQQFQLVHNKLDAISLKLDEVKHWISWETTRASYDRCEKHIKVVRQELIQYLNAPSNDREREKREFIKAYDTDPNSAKTLYHGIVEEDLVLATNLAKAVRDVTHNHRRYVMDFLRGMTRLILEGAELDIAYQKIAHGDSDAKKTENIWAARMEKLLERMKLVDGEIVHNWHGQFTADMNHIIVERHAESHQDFVRNVYWILHDKYYWRYWIVLAYDAVSGYDHHALNFLDATGYHQFRANGNRNVVAASSDPATSSFTRASGDHVLAEVAGVRKWTTDALTWLHEIDHRAGDYNHAALRAAICWDCNVWWWATEGRESHRKLTIGIWNGRSMDTRYLHTFLFG